MDSSKQNKKQKADTNLNYYETTGSAGVTADEAENITDKSLDAISDNIVTKKVQPSKTIM